MSDDLMDDEYVANLLKEDAKNSKKKYELVGIDAFNPKRQRNGAPKPNTNFLRHIIRQTDSHNAALLAKEAEESSARLRQMNKEQRREQEKMELRKKRQAQGRLTPVLSDADSRRISPRRRSDHRDAGEYHHSRRRRRDRSNDTKSRDREGRHERKRAETRRDEDSHEEGQARRSRSSRHHRHRDNRYDGSSAEEDSRSRKKEQRRHEPQSSKRSRSRSRSPRRSHHHKSSRYRDRSPHHKSRSRDRRTTKRSPRRKSPQFDSDPLEALVGPLPPPKEPPLRSRGRGAHKAQDTGINSRFSSSYDPTVDVDHEPNGDDTWGDAVEAFRDRQKWKQQGAERLKEAGFTDVQVTKWEKGDQKDEDDVVWSKRGQAREWDRGKVVDEDGDIELKAEWGRLT